mgnify:CR=1 FL=1
MLDLDILEASVMFNNLFNQTGWYHNWGLVIVSIVLGFGFHWA